MSQLQIFKRSLVAAGLAAAVFTPQNASAFGHMGGSGGRGGMAHSSFGHRGGSASHASFGRVNFGGMPVAGGGHDVRGPSNRRPTLAHLPRQPTHIVGRYPGRVPPLRVFLPPRHPWPPIFIPPYHRGPHVPPSIIVEAPRVVVPASVGIAYSAAPIRVVRTNASVQASCIADGSFISVVFVPTVTASDITAFLKAYNVTMADGPTADGIYRIRLASNVLPQNEVFKVVDSMRTQTAIVSSVDGA